MNSECLCRFCGVPLVTVHVRKWGPKFVHSPETEAVQKNCRKMTREYRKRIKGMVTA